MTAGHRNFLSWFMWLLFLTLAVSVTHFAEDWQARARIFPRLASFLGLGLATVELASLYVPAFRRLSAQRVLDLTVDNDVAPSQLWPRSMEALGYLAGLLAGIVLFGFHVAVPVFLAAYLRGKAKADWPRTLGLTAAVCFVLFVLFDQIMHMPWPRPMLRPWLPFL